MMNCFLKFGEFLIHTFNTCMYAHNKHVVVCVAPIIANNSLINLREIWLEERLEYVEFQIVIVSFPVATFINPIALMSVRIDVLFEPSWKNNEVFG